MIIDYSFSKKIKGELTMKSKQKGIIIGAVVVIIIAIIAIIANIHTCKECDKTFIGKEYKITWFDQSETVCKECYNDFYAY